MSNVMLFENMSSNTTFGPSEIREDPQTCVAKQAPGQLRGSNQARMRECTSKKFQVLRLSREIQVNLSSKYLVF